MIRLNHVVGLTTISASLDEEEEKGISSMSSLFSSTYPKKVFPHFPVVKIALDRLEKDFVRFVTIRSNRNQVDSPKRAGQSLTFASISCGKRPSYSRLRSSRWSSSVLHERAEKGLIWLTSGSMLVHRLYALMPNSHFSVRNAALPSQNQVSC